jgi:hypothetical protein
VGDAKAGSRTARAGTKRGAVRRRAVGTRDRVIAYLASVKEIADQAGMASTRLAEAVGYPGSSVAFAQLLSGMERDGLIVREVRGKRTYRITLPAGASAQATARPANPATEAGLGPAGATAATSAASPQPPAAEFDYDELARRLLIQVVRRLAASSADELGTTGALGALSEPISPEPAAPRTAAQPAARAEALSPEAATERTALEQTVAGLERELATAWTRHGTLTAENAKLREQLWEAQRSLDRARERERDRPITDELNRAEVVLLDRLLSPSREGGDQRPGATAS